MSRIACIVQARMGSTRLPGKILKEVAGKPLLEHLINRLKKAATIDDIIIATTTSQDDNQVVDFVKSLGISWHTGPEDDVLARYVGAAEKFGADLIIRITSDCPLIDPVTLDKVVSFYKMNNYDYVSNTRKLTYPRGLDTEVFSMEALQKADRMAVDQPDREHVTLYMYQHPDQFSIANVEAEPPLNRPDLRLCVDTMEDFSLIAKIYETLYVDGNIIDIREVMKLFEKMPELKHMNAHIEQKKV